MCRKKHQLVTILDRAYCCMYITEEQDASEVDELSADTSQLSLSKVPVSYTHLRAHETVLDLVCRLLLEKKK